MTNKEIEKRIEDLKFEFSIKFKEFEKAHKDKKGNISFQNDFVYKFLKDEQIAEKVFDKTKTTGEGKNKKPLISFEPFKYKNILNVSNSNNNELSDNDKVYDPFFKLWAEQVIEYWNEKKELLELYDKEIKLLLGDNKVKPIGIFLFFNNKITRIKRRVILIETLWRQNPSFSQLERNEKKIQYNSIRCFWVDDYGNNNRALYVKIDYIKLDKSSNDKNKIDDQNQQSITVTDPVNFKKEFNRIIDKYKVSYTFESEKGIYTIKGEDQLIHLRLEDIDISKFLCLVEFDFLLTKFKEPKK